MSKANVFVLMKTSPEDEEEIRLQDVFKISLFIVKKKFFFFFLKYIYLQY